MSNRPTSDFPQIETFEYGFGDSELSIRVSGRFGLAGKIEFTVSGESAGDVLLPKVQWAALAVLALAASKAPAHSIDAFVSSAQLARQLFHWKIVEIDDPQNAIRTVFRLRKRLSQLAIAGLFAERGRVESQKEFAELLIQRNNLLGYRLNVHPDQLKVDIADVFSEGM
jgi:hypothetical protein